MHIVLMLALLIVGYAAGENISWLLGLPLMVAGLLCFEFGGKKGAAWREKQEGVFVILGLGCMVFIILVKLFE